MFTPPQPVYMLTNPRHGCLSVDCVKSWSTVCVWAVKCPQLWFHSDTVTILNVFPFLCASYIVHSLFVCFLFGMQDWVTILISQNESFLILLCFLATAWKKRMRMKKGQIHCRLTRTIIENNCFTCPKQRPVLNNGKLYHVLMFWFMATQKLLNSPAGAEWKEMLGMTEEISKLFVLSSFSFFF